MKQEATFFRTFSVSEGRTLLFAAIFTIGNILLPQLCHLVPNGGQTWLPIYFFTLVGAWLYGWQLGLLVAFASPLVNSLLFGMPATAALPAILIKSSLLALAAAWAAKRYHKVSIPLLLLVVLGSQIVGCLAESLLIGSFVAGFQDFRIGIPGMLLQIIGGFIVIRWLAKKL